MISQLPLITLVAMLAALLGLFIVVRSFKMPASFDRNREEHEEARRKMANLREKTKMDEMATVPQQQEDRQPPKNNEAPGK